MNGGDGRKHPMHPPLYPLARSLGAHPEQASGSASRLGPRTDLQACMGIWGRWERCSDVLLPQGSLLPPSDPRGGIWPRRPAPGFGITRLKQDRLPTQSRNGIVPQLRSPVPAGHLHLFCAADDLASPTVTFLAVWTV